MFQDTERLLQPTLSFLRVCGIGPLNIWEPHASVAYKLYTLMLGTLACTIVTINISTIYIQLNDISFFVTTFNCVIFFVFILVSLISPFQNSKHLLKSFKTINSAHYTMVCLNIRQTDVPSVLSQISWIFILFFPSLINTIYNYYINGVYSILWLTPSAIKMASVCQIRVVLDFINSKFDLLNWHLDDLNNRWPLFLPRPPDVKFRHLSSVKQCRKTKFIQQSKDDRSVTADKIRLFNKAHLELYCALKTVNNVFSLTLLFLYLALGTALANLVLLISINVNPQMHFSAYMLLMENTLALLVISAICTLCEIKSKKAARLVHDLLNEDGHSAETVKELEKFSNALLHRRSFLTAAGFFDVNLKIISKMASILAPIILFLVQNNNRSRSGRAKQQ